MLPSVTCVSEGAVCGFRAVYRNSADDSGHYVMLLGGSRCCVECGPAGAGPSARVWARGRYPLGSGYCTRSA
jgi:hypothetical protein